MDLFCFKGGTSFCSMCVCFTRLNKYACSLAQRSTWILTYRFLQCLAGHLFRSLDLTMRAKSRSTFLEIRTTFFSMASV